MCQKVIHKNRKFLFKNALFLLIIHSFFGIIKKPQVPLEENE